MLHVSMCFGVLLRFKQVIQTFMLKMELFYAGVVVKKVGKP